MARKNVIVIKDMHPYNHATSPFGPKDIVTVISDARDLGVQLYANDNGSMYFTLPIDHPAIPLIDPLKQHYFVQRWDGSQYVDVQGGIITDYDAGENEVVISGVDYMAALGKYYTPLPGPKLGQKAIPNTDETSLNVFSSSNYTANAFDINSQVHGRTYGTRARNFPKSGATMPDESGSYITYANLLVDPNPNTVQQTVTPKAIIENAVKMDKEIHYHSSQASVAESNDTSNGDIRVYSGAPASGTTPLGKENEITVDYEVVGGVRTGTITISGSMFLFRGTGIFGTQTVDDIPYTFYDPCTGMNVGQDPTVLMLGMIIYANPGGPLCVVSEPVVYGSDSDDIGTTALPVPFSIKLRPISKYDAATEQVYGLSGRVMSILTEGVSYSFSVRPFYIGGLKILDIDSTIVPSYYENYVWGDISRYSETGLTSGLKSNTLPNIMTDVFTSVMDRNKDYADLKLSVTSANFVVSSGSNGTTTVVLPKFADSTLYLGDTVTLSETTQSTINTATSHVVASISSDRKTITLTSTGVSSTNKSSTGGYLNKANPVLVPIVKFTSLNQINTSSSSTIHPYATAGQSPIDFFREVTDIEIGTRTDSSKTVFNFYGVPGATPTGNQLIVNHAVSGTPQTTLVYPGQIRGFSVVARRSMKTNSIRVVPTTEFLLGAQTDGAVNGVRSQGVVKNAPYLASDPALPAVVSQGGFISPDSAGNFGQGMINDTGTNSDVTDIRVQLRSEVFGPIGISGTPKLGETVKVVINRKGSVIGGDMIEELYNVGGMEWVARVDGHEELFLDLVKPDKFEGPGIVWEQKPAPTSKSNPSFKANKDKAPKPDKEPKGDGFPTFDMGPGNDAGKIYNQSWWGPGGWQNIGGANDMFNIQPGRGGAYFHASYVVSTGWKKPASSTGLPKNWWKKIKPVGR